MVDCLSIVRDLKDNHGVAVFFEKENLMSTDPTSYLTLSIMASVAEEESRSISANGTWRIRKQFERGELIRGRPVFGYEFIDDTNKLKINVEQMQVVKRIFAEFLAGKSINRIAEELNRDGILSPGQRDAIRKHAKQLLTDPEATLRKVRGWSSGQINYMLKNEKYCGDACLQKSYKLDVLSKRKKNINNGEAKMFYVTNNHTAIIDREQFEAVRAELQRRAAPNSGKRTKYTSAYAFSGKLRCTECNSLYRRNQQRSRGNIKFTWVCANKLDQEGCKSAPLRERQIEDAFVIALHEVVENREQLLAEMKDCIAEAITASQDFNADQILDELSTRQRQMGDLVNIRPRTAEIDRQITELMNDMDTLKNRLDLCTQAQTNILSHKQRLKDIEQVVQGGAGLYEFSTDLFKNLVDEVDMHRNHLKFRLKCGVELSADI